MAIEILPNWHPIFVHYTLALLSVGAVLYCVAAFAPSTRSWGETVSIVAHWMIWIGALFTVATLLTGFHAYGTVAHDGRSHIAMHDHRNWALATASIAILFAGLTFFFFNQKSAFKPFSILALILVILLSVTGYKGSELVFRYGLGVKALPEKNDNHHTPDKATKAEDDHHHDHDHDHAH